MFRTELCEMLGTKYPIILGGMVWVGRSELASAVSEAGGLGFIGAGGMTIKEIERETEDIRRRTKKPFGVNIPLVRQDAWDMIETSIKGGATVITTSSGSPHRFTQMIKDRGVKVMHVVSSVKFAMKCAEAGVDIVVAEGVEAGGHNGLDELTTMALVPQVVDAVDIPVVAAGGIADGRGLVAALSLGAKGIQMGTRFIATYESAAHPNFKKAILNLTDTGTILTGRTTIGPTRCIKNSLTEMIIKAEKDGTGVEDLMSLIGEGRSVMASIEGNMDEGTAYCGQIGGLVKEMKSASQVIDDVISEARQVINSLARELL